MRSRVARGLWQVALPGLLSALAFPFLIPSVASGGLAGIVASLGRGHAVLLAALVFVALSAVARYWEPWVLGARPPREPSARAREVLRLAVGVVLAGLAAWGVRRVVVAPYVVVGASMLPTLEPDDRVPRTCPRLGSDERLPGRGEIVAFRGSMLAPDSRGGPWPEVLVKRVIGLPGDHVSMRGGSPVINGWPVPSCDAGEYMYMLSDPAGRGVHGRLRVEFLDDSAYLTVHTPAPPFEEPYEVLPGEVFVLGDNRGNSSDSRAFGAGRGAGVPFAAIDANVRWFLAGSHRSARTDLGRALSGIDSLEKRVRLEGVGVDTLQAGVAKCLTSRPAVTHPPAPTAAASAAGGVPLDFGTPILGIGDRPDGARRSSASDAMSFLAYPDDLHARGGPPRAWSVP